MRIIVAVNIFDARTMKTLFARHQSDCRNDEERAVYDAVMERGVAMAKNGIVGTPVTYDTPTRAPDSADSDTPDFLRISRMEQIGGCKGNSSPDDYDDKRYRKRKGTP